MKIGTSTIHLLLGKLIKEDFQEAEFQKLNFMVKKFDEKKFCRKTEHHYQRITKMRQQENYLIVLEKKKKTRECLLN